MNVYMAPLTKYNVERYLNNPHIIHSSQTILQSMIEESLSDAHFGKNESVVFLTR